MIRNCHCSFCESKNGTSAGVSLRPYNLLAALNITLISEQRMGRMLRRWYYFDLNSCLSICLKELFLILTVLFKV